MCMRRVVGGSRATPIAADLTVTSAMSRRRTLRRASPAATPAELSLAWQRIGSRWLSGGRAMPWSAATASDRRSILRRSHRFTERFAALTRDYQAKLALLWQAVAAATPGAPLPESRRFRPRPAFPRQGLADVAVPLAGAQAYLLHAVPESARRQRRPSEPDRKRRLKFMTRQYVDAIAPRTFPRPIPKCSSAPSPPTARASRRCCATSPPTSAAAASR